MPVALAEEVLRRGSEHAEWEDFSRLQLARSGELRRYYPLAPEAEAEYQGLEAGQFRECGRSGLDGDWAAMKIIDVKCAVIAKSPVIRIVTDEGISGWSQVETPKPYLKPIVMYLREALIGLDPVNVERVVKCIRVRGGFKPWGTAVTAIETALWDIAGKAAGLPIYRLLGGKVRDKVRTYRTLYHHEVGIGHSVADYVKWAEHGKALPEAFTMFKLPTSFHSSMVLDNEGFHTGELYPNPSYPYPHRGLLREAAFATWSIVFAPLKRRWDLATGSPSMRAPAFLPMTLCASPRRWKTSTCSGWRT
jgi:hypothetical protein